LKYRKGRFLCSEDERTRTIREEPRSIVTIGYGKECGSQPLESFRLRKFGELRKFIVREVKIPEVPKLIWTLDLRMPGSHPDHQIYEVISLALTNSGRFQSRSESTSRSPEVSKSILAVGARRHVAPDPSLQRFSAPEENGLCEARTPEGRSVGVHPDR
jgi:hypothetical protein